MSLNFHSFHMVEPRPWPIFGSICSFSFISSLIILFYSKSPLLF
ncbi:hypothetical protein FCN23_09590 [Campylobacter jejuni]|nr:hypothetical protein FCN23_09590 [Campylobacter jejuni]